LSASGTSGSTGVRFLVAIEVALLLIGLASIFAGELIDPRRSALVSAVGGVLLCVGVGLVLGGLL
jgi:hypothetical protein